MKYTLTLSAIPGMRTKTMDAHLLRTQIGIRRTQPNKTTAARNDDKRPIIVDRKQCAKERPHICVEREAPRHNASQPPKDNEISILFIAKPLVCAMSETWSQIGRRQDVIRGAKRSAPNVTETVISRTPVAEMLENVTYSKRRYVERKSGPERSAPYVTHTVISATTAS